MSKLLEALTNLQPARTEWQEQTSEAGYDAAKENLAWDKLRDCAAAVDAADAEMPLIMLESWQTEPIAAEKYHNALDWPTSAIPMNGSAAHIGGGVFAVRCCTCGQLFGTYGAQPYYSTAGRHEYETHPGAQVPGINVGLLSK